MDRQEFFFKLGNVKKTLIDARKQTATETELKSAEGFVSFIEKYGDNFIKLGNDKVSTIQVKIFESDSKEDMESQLNSFLSFPNRMIIYTGVKGDKDNYFGYILYKDK